MANTTTTAAATPATAIKPATPAPAEDAPKRFEHPGAFVLVLTPFDLFFNDLVKKSFEDECSYLEEPPKFVQELPKDQLVPNTIVYIAHPYKIREKTKSGKFEQVIKMHVSDPVDITKYYALHRANRGLDLDALQTHIMQDCIHRTSDAKGFFWIVRRTADGGLKIFDN